MASNREERLQMRQRGAGTRKIKDVNFGFSFGSPAAATTQQEALRQTSQTATEIAGSTDLPHEPLLPAQPVTGPISSKKSTGSQGDGPPRRISRNKLPERPSTFDMPLTDEAEIGRSSKRRRIGTSSLSPESPVPLISARIEEQHPLPEPSITNDNDTNAEGRRTTNNDEPIEPNGKHVQDISEHQMDPASATSQTAGAKAIGSETAATNGRRGRKSETELNGDKSSHNRHDKRKPGFPSTLNGEQSTESATHKEKETFRPSTTADQPAEAMEQDHDSTLSAGKHGRKSDKRAKMGQENTQNERSEQEQPMAKRRSGRRKASPPKTRQEQDPATSLDSDIPEAARSQPVPVTDNNEERGGSSKQLGRKQKEKETQPNTRRRGRLSVEAAQEEPEPSAVEDQPPAIATEPELPPKRRRGRPSAATNETANTRRRERGSAADHEEEAEGNTGERNKRRSETVPITVHRLANVGALGSRPADDSDGASSNEQDSGDDVQSFRKKNFPQRGGVNPADVLSQICRETIEKTLATLKNGIENESNRTRRSEWTRKRKAVEAYGAELEGRLFEMSEMLDSNFVLGVKLKKAKREMTDLRNHLLEVRQRRQEVALRMDDVRRKHSEEEDMKMSRNTINNSLHNLDLALDRNRVRHNDNADDTNEDDRSSSAAFPALAGLEFLLRTVSDSVSSNAPGSQGGLLNQVKAFNAQLETAAKRLES